MTAESLEELWNRLETSPSLDILEASEVGAGSGVWIARDARDLRHLLVEVEDREPSPQTVPTHGLAVSFGEHRVPGQRDKVFADLTCLDAASNPVFAVVAADVTSQTGHLPPKLRATVIDRALRKWKWFWGVDPSRLGVADALGLFGELWFLLKLGPTKESVHAWEGSNGARHDFQFPSQSVEVKTCTGSGPSAHTIANLEQLDDPVTGDLFLFSLRVSRDALSSNTLHTLTESILRRLDDEPDIRDDFMAKLAKRGYTPAEQGQAQVAYRVVEESLYRVIDGFPRITRSSFPDGLPRGVSQLSYVLEMSACADFQVLAGWEDDLRDQLA